jgi:hypothetical protein
MTWLARVVVAALLAATLGTPAVAQQPAPGPKGTETSEVRKKPKKKPAAAEVRKPRSIEGPELRRQDPKGGETSEVRKKPKKKPAAAEAQKPKGAESPDAKKPGQ